MALANINLMNLIFCVIIVILALWIYVRTKDTIPLYIGVAFLLFGSSHLAVLLTVERRFSTLFLIVRTVGYLAIIYALVLEWLKKCR